jgi:hypothetical protein
MTLSCDAAISGDDTGGLSRPAALLSGRFGLPPRL